MRRSVIAAIVSGQLCAFCGAARSGVVDSIPGLRLWLDAGAIEGLADGDPVTIWADSSAQGNDAVAMPGLPVPSYVASVAELNNKPVVRFGAGTSEVLGFNEVSNIRTVFWVLKKDARGVNTFNWLLGDFRCDWTDMISRPWSGGTWEFPGLWQGMSWPPEYDPAANLTTGNSDPYYNKITELNGQQVDPTVTQLPLVYSILMQVPSGGRRARQVAGWEGDMSEIVVYDRELSAEEIQQVGSYLAEKYGLAGTGYGGVMKWDGTQNEWGTAHWTAASPPPPPGSDFPDQWIHAVMENTGGMAVCSVADADRSAGSLTMTGGTDAANSNRLAIAADRTLTVAGRLDAGADWNSVTLGDNARLRFGQIGTVNGSIWVLEIEGDATVENAGNAPITSFDDTWQPGMPQRTLVKQGSGTLRMDNSGGTIQAAHTTFRIEQGTVQVGGPDPLGGSTVPVELAGGFLSVKAPVTDYLPGLNHGVLYSYYERNDPNPQNLPRDPLGPSITESADEPPWADYITFVYSGEIFLPDDGSGAATVSFFEEVDDTAYLAVDGQTVLNNVGYSDRSAATVTLKSGWRPFELRVSNGYGPAGLPFHAWPPPLGFGYALGDTGGKPDGSLYTHPQNSDEHTMDVFRAPVLGAISMAGTDFVVSAPGSGLNAYSPGKTAAFGNLTMLDGGELTTTGTVGKITFTGTKIASDAKAVGFGPDVPTDYGEIDAQGADVTLYKVGKGTWTPETAASNLGPQAAWGVKQGTLRLVGEIPWGTARLAKLVGGTLVVGQPQGVGAPELPAIAGLQLHLDASALGGLAHGDRLPQWEDLSGNGRHLVQADSARQPTYLTDVLNGLPVVHFDPGSSSSQSDQMTSGGTPWTAREVFAVVSLEYGAPESSCVLGGGSSGITVARLMNTNAYSFWGAALRINDQVTDRFSYDQAHIVEATAETDQTYDSFMISGRASGSTYWKGDIAEILIYDRPLSQRERHLVGHYLETKYAVDTSYLGGAVPLAMTDYDFVVDAGMDWDGSFLPCTLDADTRLTAQFGRLTLKNGILATRGAFEGMSFTGTTIDAEAGAVVGIAPETPTDLGAIDVARTTPVTFSKRGPVDLVLTPASRGTGWGSHVTVDVAAGRLILVRGEASPIADAPLQLSGGELALSSIGGDFAVTNPVTVSADTTLSAGQFGPGVAGPVTVTLTDLTLGDAVLTLSTPDVGGDGDPGNDYRIAVGQATSRSGGLHVAGGVAFAKALSLGRLIVSGELTRSGAGTPDGDLAVTNSLAMAGGSLDMTGNTLTTDGAEIQITGGTLTVASPLSAASVNVSAGAFHADGGLAAMAANLSGGLLRTAGELTVENVHVSGGLLTAEGGLTALNADFSGGTLQVAGVLTATNLNITGGTSNVAGLAANTVSVVAGELNLGGATVHSMTVGPAAMVNTGQNQVVVNHQLKLGTPAWPTFSIDSPANPFMVSGSDLSKNDAVRTITTTGGRLTIADIFAQGVLPTDGLVCRLDASAIGGLNNGNAISIWEDQSGLGNHLKTTAGAPTYQSAAVNGQPAVHFTTNDQMASDTFFDNPYTILYVGQMQGTANRRLLTSVSHNWLLGYWDNNMNVMFANGWVNRAGDPGTFSPPDSEPHIFAATGTGTETRNYSDGTDLTALSKGGVFPPGRISFNTFGDERSNADVAEVIIFDRVLAEEELQVVGVLLAAKYGLTTAYQGARTLDLPHTNLLVTANTELDLIAMESAALGNLRLMGDPDPTVTLLGAPEVSFADVSGSGTVAGHVRVRDVLDPGQSVGTLNVTDLTMQDGSIYHWELGGSVADLVVAGELALPLGGWSLKLIDGGATSVDADLVLFRYTSLADNSLGTCTIDTSEVSRWSFADGGPWLYNDAEHDRVLLTGVAAVPEPGTLLLLVSGALGLLLLLRRRPKGAALGGQ